MIALDPLMERPSKAPADSTPCSHPPVHPPAPTSGVPPASTPDGIRVLSAASGIIYGVEVLRSLLANQFTPELGSVLNLLEERAAQIQRDLPDILRAARYATEGRQGPHRADGLLADALRCELDSLPLAEARCIHPTGWLQGRRPVPLRVARDALRPVLDVALATGRRRILVQFHGHASKGPWMTVSWCLRAASQSCDAMGPARKSPEADGPIPALAALAALQLGCAWHQAATAPRRFRLELTPQPAMAAPPPPGRCHPQAGSRNRAKATRPKAVRQAFAKSNSVPKR